MMCYKDRTYCSSEIHKPDCDRQFTEQDRIDAIKWWGSESFPVAYSNFCDEITDFTN